MYVISVRGEDSNETRARSRRLIRVLTVYTIARYTLRIIDVIKSSVRSLLDIQAYLLNKPAI